ncbi:MAG: hypothetical protein J7L61_04715, partial [Thermoplasmata archaeon]|nr:hypothetical protein [Thermoplasmata archaeon]
RILQGLRQDAGPEKEEIMAEEGGEVAEGKEEGVEAEPEPERETAAEGEPEVEGEPETVVEELEPEGPGGFGDDEISLVLGLLEEPKSMTALKREARKKGMAYTRLLDVVKYLVDSGRVEIVPRGRTTLYKRAEEGDGGDGTENEEKGDTNQRKDV